jgi:hypothetical protein
MKHSIVASSLLLSLVNLSACGGSSSRATATNDGGTESANNLATTCGLSNAQVFVPSRIYGDGSPIGDIRLSPEYVTFSPYDQVYSMPLNGGQPTLISGVEQGWYDAGHIFGSQLVFVQSNELLRVPIAGGTVTHETLFDDCSNVSRVFSMDNSRVYCDSGNRFSGTPTAAFWSYDLKSKQTTPLFSANTSGVQDEFALAGDAIYVHQEGGDGVRDRLFKLPIAGGAEVEVPISGDYDFDIVGSGVDGLYIAAKPIPTATGEYGGIYRIALEGGSPKKLLDGPIIGPSVIVSLGTSKGNTIVRVLDDIYEIPPNGEATLLAHSACQLFAMAASDTDLFVSAETSDGYTYEILRMPL